MVERFLFDRIDAKAARAPIRVELDRTSLGASDEAEATLTFVDRSASSSRFASSLFASLPFNDSGQSTSGRLTSLPMK
jgi:hypothetical protein